MARLRLSLLGKFRIQQNGQLLTALEGRKIQELLGYLVIHRERPHVRERLAELLWPDKSPSHSRRYLRQTLWQIQSTLDADFERDDGLIMVESDWLQINPEADCWSDVAQLEACANRVHSVPGEKFSTEIARQVKTAVRFYRGDLLENCYQDWCILERERLQNIYLGLLDKLMDYCLVRQEFGIGLVYGSRILRSDVARERTYRKLMRLHYLNNDRTGALRQYWRCCQALKQEFGVEPAKDTVTLYKRMRDDQPLIVEARPHARKASAFDRQPYADDVLKDLDQITATMLEAYERLQRDVSTMREVLQNNHQIQ